MSEPTREERLGQLATAEALLKQTEADVKSMRQELGLEAKEVPGQAADEVEGLARRFQNLTAAEKTDLYTNHPEEWRRLLGAVERMGARELLSKGNRWGTPLWR